MDEWNDVKSTNAELEPILNFTSLGEPLLRFIISLIDQTSLPQVRLVNHLLKQLVDETINFYILGTAPKYSGIQDLQAEVNHACRLWPVIREIKVRSPTIPHDVLAQGQNRSDLAIESLLDANWTEIQILNCSSCRLGPAAAVSLARCSRLWNNLRTLNLQCNNLGAAGIENLACGDFPVLERLDVSQNGLGPEGGAPLIKRLTRCPNLRELDRTWNRIHHNLELLFKSDKCPLVLLETISLRDNFLGSGCGNLVGATKWPFLQKLILHNNGLDDIDIQGVCQGKWPLLEHLEIIENVFGVEGALTLRNAACGTAPAWPRLRVLDITSSLHDIESLEVLLEGEWKALTRLALDCNPLGTAGSRILASAYNRHRLPALTSLSLYDTSMNASAIFDLFSVCWGSVERLELGGEEYDEAVGAALAAVMVNNRLPALKEFELINCGYNTGYMIMFKVAWKELEMLSIVNCRISLEGITALVEATESNRLPKVRLLILEDLNDDEALEYAKETRYEEEEEEDKDIVWVGYGGAEGIEMLLNAEWPSLEEIVLRNSFHQSIVQGKRVGKWRVAGKDNIEILHFFYIKIVNFFISAVGTIDLWGYEGVL